MCNSCARMKEDSWHIVAMDSAWREHRSLDENMSRSNTKCVGCDERTAVCIGPSATADGRLETDHRAAGRGSPVLRAMKNPSSHTSQASAFLSYLLFFFFHSSIFSAFPSQNELQENRPVCQLRVTCFGIHRGINHFRPIKHSRSNTLNMSW